MHGPVWNDPKAGVTGEVQPENFRTLTPNFVTYRDEKGMTRSLVGPAADEYRRLHPTA